MGTVVTDELYHPPGIRILVSLGSGVVLAKSLFSSRSHLYIGISMKQRVSTVKLLNVIKSIYH